MVRTIKKKPKKKNNKSIQRMNRKDKRGKTVRKGKRNRMKQKGGMGALAIIAGISTLAITALGAFAKYKHSELLKERSKIDNIIGQDSNLEYIPKYFVVEDKNVIERYLKCVTDGEFIEIISENQDYLKSDTINNLIKPYRNMDPELKDLSEKYDMLLGDTNTDLKIDTIELTTTNDSLVKELRYYLLAVATLKESDKSRTDKNKIAKDNINWVDIIIDGGVDYDHKYELEVDRILEDRGSSYFITDEIITLLRNMNTNDKLIQAINKKMENCTREPRGYWDFISGNIKWNNTKKCLVCPDEDCLIYIYDYYYDFLKDNDNIPILHKIYVLMLCEARICALSKPLILEALRQNSGDKSYIKELLSNIYERDKSRNLVSTTIPSKFSDISVYKKPTKERLLKETELMGDDTSINKELTENIQLGGSIQVPSSQEGPGVNGPSGEGQGPNLSPPMDQKGDIFPSSVVPELEAGSGAELGAGSGAELGPELDGSGPELGAGSGPELDGSGPELDGSGAGSVTGSGPESVTGSGTGSGPELDGSSAGSGAGSGAGSDGPI